MENKEKSLSEKKVCVNKRTQNWHYKEPDVKEFIKIDWVLTNHFITDVLRDCNIDEDYIYNKIKKLYIMKQEIIGNELMKNV